MTAAVNVAQLGNGPAFYAFASASTAVAANTNTKVNFQTELFDTNSNYDPSTGRFQPTTPGYYFLAATVRCDTATNSITHTYINHSRIGVVGTGSFFTVSSGQSASHASTLAFFNGTTDFADISVYVAVAGNTFTGQGNTYFTGFLARGA